MAQKKISDMTPAEQKIQRERWKIAARKSRKNKKEQSEPVAAKVDKKLANKPKIEKKIKQGELFPKQPGKKQKLDLTPAQKKERKMKMDRDRFNKNYKKQKKEKIEAFFKKFNELYG